MMKIPGQQLVSSKQEFHTATGMQRRRMQTSQHCICWRSLVWCKYRKRQWWGLCRSRKHNRCLKFLSAEEQQQNVIVSNSYITVLTTILFENQQNLLSWDFVSTCSHSLCECATGQQDCWELCSQCPDFGEGEDALLESPRQGQPSPA